ncbi:MAG: AI-2E family transporter [Candidatus Pacearchaeota archaeon]
MIDEKDMKNFIAAILFLVLILLSILILKPIILSILLAFILAFIFSPVYNWLFKHTKSKDLSAILIIIFLFIIILTILWFFVPILVKQSFDFFQKINKIDIVELSRSISSGLPISQPFSKEISDILSSFLVNMSNKITNSIAEVIINSPIILLHLLVILFTFFFVLRDKDLLVSYIKDLLPFSKEVKEKLFEYSVNITSSILYGQVIVGILQGLIVGAAFFIFGVPKALLLTTISILFGILPIIGPSLVWVPVLISLIITKASLISIIGIAFFGTISSSIDNYLRPLIVSKKVNIHQGVVLISMIGGLLFFGVLGFILGPLIISYLIVFLDVYKKKFGSEVFSKSSDKH